MKRKHFELIGLFLLGLILIGIFQYLQGITGNAVSESNGNFVQNSFKIENLKVESLGDSLDFSFDLNNDKLGERELEVNYELFNANGESFVTGSKEIILTAKGARHYRFSFSIREYYDLSAALGVEVFDADSGERDYASIPVQRYKLTGNAVSNSEGEFSGKGYIVLVLVGFIGALSILLFFVRKYHTKKQIVELSRQIHENGSIKLR
ncbi:MAG: hypothetical protein AABX11_02000 [Nanoarchaeota archaeon]